MSARSRRMHRLRRSRCLQSTDLCTRFVSTSTTITHSSGCASSPLLLYSAHSSPDTSDPDQPRQAKPNKLATVVALRENGRFSIEKFLCGHGSITLISIFTHIC